jgi:hypothetical protein
MLALRIQAQNVLMRGNVKDAITNEPVSLAGIINKATKTGNVARMDGSFELSTYRGALITFSAIGYKNTVVDIPYNLSDDTLDIVVVMFRDTLTIKEISIRAYPTRAQFATVFVNNSWTKILFTTQTT